MNSPGSSGNSTARRCELLSPQALLQTCFCRLLTCLALQKYFFGSGYFWAPDGESCLVINGPAVLTAVMQNGGKFVDGVQVVPESVLQPLVGFLRNKMPGNGPQGDQVSAKLQAPGRCLPKQDGSDSGVEGKQLDERPETATGGVSSTALKPPAPPPPPPAGEAIAKVTVFYGKDWKKPSPCNDLVALSHFLDAPREGDNDEQLGCAVATIHSECASRTAVPGAVSLSYGLHPEPTEEWGHNKPTWLQAVVQLPAELPQNARKAPPKEGLQLDFSTFAVVDVGTATETVAVPAVEVEVGGEDSLSVNAMSVLCAVVSRMSQRPATIVHDPGIFYKVLHISSGRVPPSASASSEKGRRVASATPWPAREATPVLREKLVDGCWRSVARTVVSAVARDVRCPFLSTTAPRPYHFYTLFSGPSTQTPATCFLETTLLAPLDPLHPTTS